MFDHARDRENEDSAGEDEEQAGEGEADPDAPRNPETKADMDKLRQQFQNSIHLCQYFYGDRELQVDFRILYEGAKEMIDEFVRSLDMQSNGQDDCQQYYNLCPVPYPEPKPKPCQDVV